MYMMIINLPESTYIHRRMTKEAFYSNLKMNPQLRSAFVNDVDRIFIENGLSADNLHLPNKSAVEVIYVMQMYLKKPDFDGKVVEAIARQNPHKLLFLLTFENRAQLALYQGKLYRSSWQLASEMKLEANGQSLQQIWDGFIEQIALTEEQPGDVSGLSVEERLKRQDRIQKVEQNIEKTEAAAWKEKQPHKRFELHQRIQKLKQELEDLKNG